MFCVHKRNVSVRRFFHTHTTCLIGKSDNNNFWVEIPPVNSNFRYYDIKSLGPRTSNLRDSTVLLLFCHLCNGVETINLI